MDPRTSAQDVMRCDLCETAVVQMHCDTCLVNLCKACVGEHFSADLSKPHKIVDYKDRKSTPLYPGCPSHNEQQCTIYCNQCDISVCNTCIGSDQHLGHKLSEILKVVDEKKNKFIKEQTELNETIYPTYQDIASDVQNRMSQLEKEYGDLSTAITKHGEVWHREIDKLVKELKAELDEVKDKQLQTLQKHLDEINKKISEIKDEINLIDVAVITHNISKIIGVSSNVAKYKCLPKKCALCFPIFMPGRIQVEDFKKLFGALSSSSLTPEQGYNMKTTQKSPEAGTFPPVKQLLNEVMSDVEDLLSTTCKSEEVQLEDEDLFAVKPKVKKQTDFDKLLDDQPEATRAESKPSAAVEEDLFHDSTLNTKPDSKQEKSESADDDFFVDSSLDKKASQATKAEEEKIIEDDDLFGKPIQKFKKPTKARPRPKYEDLFKDDSDIFADVSPAKPRQKKKTYKLKVSRKLFSNDDKDDI